MSEAIHIRNKRGPILFSAFTLEPGLNAVEIDKIKALTKAELDQLSVFEQAGYFDVLASAPEPAAPVPIPPPVPAVETTSLASAVKTWNRLPEDEAGALAMVAETKDSALLNAWFDLDQRPAVTAAIVERLKALDT